MDTSERQDPSSTTVAPPLTPEIISLVHHVELNRQGWWDQAVQRMLLTVLWKQPTVLSQEQIHDAVQTTFLSNIDGTLLSRNLSRLVSKNEILNAGKGKYKIAESMLSKLNDQVATGENIEVRAREYFAAAIQKHCASVNIDIESLWRRFVSELLVPVVRELGAGLYRLFDGKSISISSDRIEGLLSSVSAELRAGIRLALSEFLNPNNLDVRAFLLRHLNAYFILESGSLSNATLMKLNVAKSNISFVLFADTNVVFSILGLHDNPANDTTSSLTSLAKQLDGRANVKFYILPCTVDEATRTLAAIESSLKGARLTQNLIEGAKEAGLSGITRRFLREAEDDSDVSLREFLSPYIDNLIYVCREKGVELFNEKIDAYHQDRRVLDGINEQQEFERQQGYSRPKTYEKLFHDLVLWYFANDKRGAVVESPLDAKYWVVTLDGRLLGFDANLTKRMGKRVPICVHPATLIQMLQFWVPRTAEFEAAMVSALRLPILAEEFNVEAEKMSIRILKSLARHENIGNLSRETVARILVSDVLRHKMSEKQDSETDSNLIKEILIDENRLMESRLKELQKELEAKRVMHEGNKIEHEGNKANFETIKLQYQSEIKELSREIASREAVISAQGNQVRELLTAQQDMSKTVESLAAELASLKSAREMEEIGRQAFGAKLKFGVGCFSAQGLVFFISLLFWHYGVGKSHPYRFWLITGIVISVTLCITVVLAKRNEHLNKTIWFKVFHYAAFVLLGAIPAAVLGNAVYDWVKIAVAEGETPIDGASTIQSPGASLDGSSSERRSPSPR